MWTAEFAGAGWIRPFAVAEGDGDDFVAAAWRAAHWRDTLFALPWFVDAGLLYWRTDLLESAPGTLSQLRDAALHATAGGAPRFGLVWQGARYDL